MPKGLNKRTLKKIKKRLPKGWKETIADNMNLQPETVRKVMGGIRKNDHVVKTAISLANLPENEKTELLEKLTA